MEISTLQIILITLYAFIAINDSLISNTLQQAVIAGMITGLIMGDVTTGLLVGGTLQLMRLGLAAFGGASIPDYFTGAVIGTVFAILSGQDAETGIGIAVPVALLMLQLDILARFCNVFIQHAIDRAIEKMNVKAISPLVLSGSIFWGLSRAVPIFLMLILGNQFLTDLIEVIPEQLLTGLKVAGGVLPVVGVAILLRYLPTKKYIPFLLLGFFLAAYLEVPVFGVTIVGLIAAMLSFKMDSKSTAAEGVTAGGEPTTLEGGFDDDE